MKPYFKAFLLCIGLFSASLADSQVYKHGVGAQLDIISFKESYTDNSGLTLTVHNAFIPGILYRGSLGFQLSRTTTLNLTILPYFGIGPKEFDKNITVAELPIIAEFFFGDVDYMGGFVGLGGSFTYSSISSFGNGNVIGPQIEGGFQFPINDQLFSAKISYTYGLNKPSISAYPNRVYSKTERGIFSVGMVYMFIK